MCYEVQRLNLSYFLGRCIKMELYMNMMKVSIDIFCFVSALFAIVA